jgi:hypothetical protein
VQSNTGKIFPLMLWKNSDVFSFNDSNFAVQKAKASTARVVYWREHGISNSFTLEVIVIFFRVCEWWVECFAAGCCSVGWVDPIVCECAASIVCVCVRACVCVCVCGREGSGGGGCAQASTAAAPTGCGH